jgi:hypothetical protein
LHFHAGSAAKITGKRSSKLVRESHFPETTDRQTEGTRQQALARVMACLSEVGKLLLPRKKRVRNKLVALIVQLLAYFLAHQLLPHLPRDVADGKLASGVFLGAMAIALDLLNAARMSY